MIKKLMKLFLMNLHFRLTNDFHLDLMKNYRIGGKVYLNFKLIHKL
jgi:hypothetical protein